MKKALVAILSAALLASAAPLAAFTLIERGSTFEITVRLTQAFLCDGSVRLEAGPYKLQVTSLGEDKVQAKFTDLKTGKTGEARGIIAVLRQDTPSEQKVQPGENKVQPGGAVALNFTKLGFGPNSQVNFKPNGPQKVNLEITSHGGSHSITIGLLLPAVQKVREAAAAPAK